MSDYLGGSEGYLNQGNPDRERVEIEITGVIEDLPGDMSGEGNMNRMKLATSKGEMIFEFTNQQREAILSGRLKKLVLYGRGSDASALTLMLSGDGGLDYSGNGADDESRPSDYFTG